MGISLVFALILFWKTSSLRWAAQETLGCRLSSFPFSLTKLAHYNIVIIGAHFTQFVPFLLLDLNAFLGLIIGNNHSVILILPHELIIVKLKTYSLHIRNVESLVILFVCGFQNHLLLRVVDFNIVSLLWIWQIPYAPLESFIRVFPHEHWVLVGCRY